MRKYKILKGSFSLLLVITALGLSSCASNPAGGEIAHDAAMKKLKADTEAKKYNLVLLDAIQDADKIVIREHSDKVDFFGMVPEIQSPPQYVYNTKELSIGEKIEFQKDVMALRGLAKSRITNSLFTPHHTIEFYEQGALKSTMKICFQCPSIQWDATIRRESEDVYLALGALITRSGMQMNKPWDAMAKQKYSEENQLTPPRPDPNPGGVPFAKWAPGQIGKKVINPYTGNLVDVEGIPANTKVRDPNDPDPTHVFRVPAIQ